MLFQVQIRDQFSIEPQNLGDIRGRLHELAEQRYRFKILHDEYLVLNVAGVQSGELPVSSITGDVVSNALVELLAWRCIPGMVVTGVVQEQNEGGVRVGLGYGIGGFLQANRGLPTPSFYSQEKGQWVWLVHQKEGCQFTTGQKIMCRVKGLAKRQIGILLDLSCQQPGLGLQCWFK